MHISYPCINHSHSLLNVAVVRKSSATVSVNINCFCRLICMMMMMKDVKLTCTWYYHISLIWHPESSIAIVVVLTDILSAELCQFYSCQVQNRTAVRDLHQKISVAFVVLFCSGQGHCKNSAVFLSSSCS